MSSEENKMIARRFIDAIHSFWHTGEFEALEAVVTPDFAHHGPGLPPDLAGTKQMLPAFRAAFPDMEIKIDDLVAEGDKVVDHVTWQATHQGELMGIPPTGKQVAVSETHIYRIAGGKVVERWFQWDALGMMQQLGVIPPPEQA
jgi:steroid delta-isomerase-like uncharacterized protein